MRYHNQDGVEEMRNGKGQTLILSIFALFLVQDKNKSVGIGIS